MSEDNLKHEFVDIGNARDPKMIEWYEKLAEEGIDPFSIEHFKKVHPNPIISENENWFLTTNAVPYSGCKHHFLIVSKQFATKLSDLTRVAWVDFYDLIYELEKSEDLDGHALFMRMGDTRKTGASVTRIHAHLIVPEENESESGRTAIFPTVFKK